MTIITEDLPKKIAFKLNGRSPREIGDRPYLATIECDTKQIKVILTSNDKRADLTTTIEISNGLPVIHLSDAYGIESALSLRVSEKVLYICPNESDALIKDHFSRLNYSGLNYGGPLALLLPISNQALAIYAGRQSASEGNDSAEIDLHSEKIMRGTLSDYSDDVTEPYSVRATIQSRCISLTIFSRNGRPGIVIDIETDNSVPDIRFSGDECAPASLHIHATMNGLHICPPFYNKIKRDKKVLGNAVHIALERSSRIS